MAEPTWTLSDDRTTLTIAFPSNPPVALVLSAAQADELLRNVALYRGGMVPQVTPMEWPRGQRAQAVPDPAWTCEPDALQGHSLLHLRDPRYGWLHYLLPPHEAAKLAGFLKVQAEAPPPGPPHGKPN